MPDLIGTFRAHCRTAGCYNCVATLEHCPFCRGEFKCTVCQNPLPQNAQILPGIADVIEIPPVDVVNEGDAAPDSAIFLKSCGIE